MRTRWVVLLVVASNLLTLAIVVGLGWHEERYSFDAAEWHARLPGDCNDGHREKMVDDLADNYLQVGMTRADVLWLLGPADYEQGTKDAGPLLGWDIGMDFSDCEEFFVNFAQSGKLVIDWSGR